MTWSGRTVLVTGATSGVGRALARCLAAKGALVLAHGRDIGRLEAVAAEVGGQPVRSELSTRDGATVLAESALATIARMGWPGLAVLVNNAAVQHTYLFTDRTPADHAEAVAHEAAVDFTAPMQLTALLLPALRDTARTTQTPSAVVYVTSGLALAPKKRAAVYCAAKAGLRTFSKALRYQMEDAAASGAPRVLVTEAMLPLVDTPMTAARTTRVAKISPAQAAAEIMMGLEREQAEIRVGKAALFARIHRWVPAVAERMLRDG